MPHSFIANRVHVVFSTRQRKSLIPADDQNRLWSYFVGIGKNLGAKIFIVGGTSNHVHMLIELPGTIPLSTLLQKLKGSSSKWMSDSGVANFKWQEGFAAFSVSASAFESVRSYIEGQEAHHAKHTFEDEFRSLLVKYGIAFDERYLFG